MLKKNHNPTFTRPDSAMRVVLQAVEDGKQTRKEIVSSTRLEDGKVRSALYNLAFIGAVVRRSDRNRISVYSVPNTRVEMRTPACLKGIRSIFDVGSRRV